MGWQPLGTLVPLLHLLFLVLIPCSKSSLAYLASYVGLSVRNTFAHRLCSEYFGFYGSDFSLQINGLELGLWFSFPL